MAINFPTSPSVDATYTYLDQTWICTSADPVIWEKSAATETGNTEGNTFEVAYYDTKGSVIKGATAFYYDSTNLKVGIGTSGPDQTLGVSGDFYVSGGATLAGAMVIQGNNVTGFTSSGGATFYAGIGLPQNQFIYDSASSPILQVGANRTVHIGDVDSQGNDTKFSVTDSKSEIQMSADTVSISKYLTHIADINTKLVFHPEDTLALHCGGVTFAQGVYDTIYTKLGAPQGITASSRSEFDGITADQFAVRGGGISCDAGATFGGDVIVDANFLYINGALAHNGDSNTKLVFATDNIKLQSGGNEFLEGTSTQVIFPLGISADAGATFAGDVIFHSGVSADVGATFGGNVKIKGTSNFLEFPDGTTMGSTQLETIGISVSNGSQVLTTGTKGHRTIPYDCTIVDWRVTSRDSGAIEWGLSYATYANFPTMTDFIIHTSEAPGIAASGSKDESGGAISARWEPYQLSAGTIIQFDIDSVSSLTNCILELTIRRTS
tara:strand:- start:2392 stop:3876 length:1485 start_codon:yes stop_codon:yes gene_type:complete